MPPTVVLAEDRETDLPLLAALEARYRVHVLRQGEDASSLPRAHGATARALVTTAHRGVDAALIAALPNVEVICVAGGHDDRVDLDAARARGVQVALTPEVAAADMADVAMALILATARRMVEADRFVRRGDWRGGMMTFSARVHGKRLGIVGFGHVGRVLARRAAGFAMPVRYHGRRREVRADADNPADNLADNLADYVADPVALAEAVDFLAVTCRPGPDRQHTVGEAVLKALGPAGVVVNVCRGALDDRALLRALEEGWIAGAGLDAFEDAPDVPAGLLCRENVVLLPRMGGRTWDTMQTLVARILANLDAHFAGEPLPDPAQSKGTPRRSRSR